VQGVIEVMNRRDGETFTQDDQRLLESIAGQAVIALENAQRFELGDRHTAAIVGQAAALRWLEEDIGYTWIFERITSLSTYAYHALQELPGLTMLTPRPAESGLVAFKLDGKDDVDAVTTLREKHNIYIRNSPERHALRISTGFYDTEEEIDTLVRALYEL